MTRRPASIDAAVDAARHTGEQVAEVSDHVRALMAEFKPRLRGWLHTVSSPLALLGGLVLIALSPTTAARVGSSVFVLTALLLFTVSGVYHRGRWGPRAWSFLRRFDHANIFLLIAGSYTPFCLMLLEGTQRTVLLTLVWVGATLGALFRIYWTQAPRWLYVPIYIALGWAAVFVIDDLAAAGGAAVMTFVVLGGALYTIGGAVYGFKRPNPFPGWFGYHEVFHALTVVAFLSHYVGVSIATYSLR